MKKLELIVSALSIIAIFLDFFLVPGGLALTALTFLTLSFLYLSFGYALFNDIRFRKLFKGDALSEISTQRILGAIGAGLALSMTSIGLMFKFLHWPGATITLYTGMFGLLIVSIVGTIKYTRTKSPYYTRIFKRIAFFGGLGLVLILIPSSTLFHLKYRNHQAYISAVQKAEGEPDNDSLWDKVEEERSKIYEGENE